MLCAHCGLSRAVARLPLKAGQCVRSPHLVPFLGLMDHLIALSRFPDCNAQPFQLCSSHCGGRLHPLEARRCSGDGSAPRLLRAARPLAPHAAGDLQQPQPGRGNVRGALRGGSGVKEARLVTALTDGSPSRFARLAFRWSWGKGSGCSNCGRPAPVNPPNIIIINPPGTGE